METEIVLRTATPADLEALLELQRACPSAAAWGVADYRHAFADAAAVCLLEEDSAQKRPAGFLVGCIAADELEILNLAVHGDYRRQGLGRRLVGEALARARERGVRRCWLEVRAANQEAREFYRALGFTESGRRRRYYRNPEDDAVICTRRLETGAAP